MKTVLLTGASGFIGKEVLARLLREGLWSARAAYRKLPSEPPACEVCLCPGGGTGEEWKTAVQGVDIVIHCAARVHVMRDTVDDPLREFLAVNRDFTESLARQAAEAGVKRFVFLSSIKVNGETTSGGEPFKSEDHPNPSDSYGVSKKEAEEVLRAIGRETGMDIVIIRPPLVYGPDVKGNFESLLKLSDSGLPIPLGAVKNKRSMVSLGNLVDFMLHCCESPLAANETFIISDGHDVSTAELITEIRAAMGRSPRLLPVPVFLFRLAGLLTGKSSAVERLVGSLQVDSSKASRLLGWTPPYSVEEGISAVVDRFRKMRHSD